VIEFEFDSSKSRTNTEKHGINFHEAQVLWTDPYLLEISARSGVEPRFLSIGLIEGVHWSAIVTYRNGRVRIISVRRSRIEEVTLYESNRFRQEVR